MPFIYQLDAFSQWTGQVQAIEEDGGFPPGWVATTAPPQVPAGQVAVWISGEWKLRGQPMVPDLDHARRAALDEIASQRWEATQFFTFDGVRTQADGAIAVVTARLALRREAGIPDAVAMKFKLGRGEFRSWNKVQEVAFGAAIGAHVQACFDREEELTTEIMTEAETAADIAMIVDQARTSWPS